MFLLSSKFSTYCSKHSLLSFRVNCVRYSNAHIASCGHFCH